MLLVNGHTDSVDHKRSYNVLEYLILCTKYWLQRVFGNIEPPIGEFRITGLYQPDVDNCDMARRPYDGGTSF